MTAAPPGAPDPSSTLPVSSGVSVGELFSRQAENFPELPAVEYGGHRWTYAELARRSRRTARRLRERGVRRGDVVSVTGPRTPELIAAILAVFMAEAVLLPVDPLLPAARRELTESLGAAHWRVRVGHGNSTIEPVTEDSGGGRTAEEPAPSAEEEPAPAAELAGQAGYIFLTSGTTGTPRAVLGSHRGLSHFLQWQRHEFGVGPGDRCAQLTRLSFDVVLRDVLLPLVSGAALCLPERGEDLAPDDVVPWLESRRITLVHAVPTLAHLWLSDTRPRAGAPLRVVFFAGEPLSGALVDRWRSVFPATERVVNLYGPTETTLAVCGHVVDDPAPAGTQPLGRPLPGAQVLILDGHGDPCAAGQPGEIAIRNPFGSLGYLNDPEETERRFVPGPPGDARPGRVFRTGDRGRYGADGRVEFLGRLDHQVKVLGVRVQPEEVTAALLSHPGISAGAVLAHTDPTARTRLEGYYVPLTGARAPTPAEVRAHLRALLPLPLVPATLTAVDRLPTTPRGKLDRKALRSTAEDAPDTAPAPPSDAVEEALAEIWAEVLDLATVNRHDDFFELGGHSLLAARMFSRIKQRLGVRIGLRQLLKAPELSEFAGSVRRTVAGAPHESPIRRLPRPGPASPGTDGQP
ncbi:non-ribosomal peptide synthetase [Streptomyces sp. HNM1019]|uniref:non-ribosomal peptide synthetase n=1 Tax=Streptomyces sp. HNM1019 TaxID=3424717 RepID=UPI003D78920F